MRKPQILLSALTLSLLVACGDKLPPTDPGASPGGSDLGSGSITPIVPVTPSIEPSFDPNDNIEPTDEPIEEPTEEPLEEPTEEPTEEPSVEPSPEPTPEPTPTPIIIEAPTGVTSSNIGLTSFQVNWSGPANANVYRIYLDGVLKTDNITGNSMTLSGLEQGKDYSVEITAVTSASEESAKSTALTVTTKVIAVPTNLAASDIDANSAKITWDAAAEADSYTIYVNGTKVEDDITTTSFELTDLDPETTYAVTVTTENELGESVKSEALSVVTPNAYGNVRLGFLNMNAIDNPDGLDIKNGHAYVGYYKYTDGFLSDSYERFIRDLNMASGQVKDTLVSEGNPEDSDVYITGMAINAAVIWTTLESLDEDGWNLYKFNINGQRLQRYKIGDGGTLLSDLAVDASNGLVYIASRTHKNIVKFNEVTQEAQYSFTGAVNIDPIGLAIDTDGQVYTFDTISRKIIKFSKTDGSRLLEFGPTGTNNGGENFTAVTDLAVDPRNGDIYITGNASGQVKVFRFDKDGKFIRSFKDADLTNPRKMWVDADGKVYVIDATKKGVLAFSAGTTP